MKLASKLAKIDSKTGSLTTIQIRETHCMFQEEGDQMRNYKLEINGSKTLKQHFQLYCHFEHKFRTSKCNLATMNSVTFL